MAKNKCSEYIMIPIDEYEKYLNTFFDLRKEVNWLLKDFLYFWRSLRQFKKTELMK